MRCHLTEPGVGAGLGERTDDVVRRAGAEQMLDQAGLPGEPLGGCADAAALENGELIGIFPEGRLTDNGDIYPFKGGIKRIIERTPVAVIPMALRGLWGSFFSRKDGPAMTRPLRRGILSRIALVVAPPVQAALVTPESMQVQVEQMRGEWK